MRRTRILLLALSVFLSQPLGVWAAEPVWPDERGWLVYFVVVGVAANVLYAVLDRLVPASR